MTIEYLAELRRRYRATHAIELAEGPALPAPTLPLPAPMPGRIERVKRSAMIRALDAELVRRSAALQRGTWRPKPGPGTTAVIVPFPAPHARSR